MEDEDELMMQVIEAGADDMVTEEGAYEVYMAFEELDKVRSSLESAGVEYTKAEGTFIPQNTVPLDAKQAEQMLKLMDALEENDDVQHVYANFDIDESVMESLGNN